MRITGNEPVNPILDESGDAISVDYAIAHYGASGLTIRQRFAAMAMQGLISNQRMYADMAAKEAIRYADALIKELNETPNPNERGDNQ